MFKVVANCTTYFPFRIFVDIWTFCQGLFEMCLSGRKRWKDEGNFDQKIKGTMYCVTFYGLLKGTCWSKNSLVSYQLNNYRKYKTISNIIIIKENSPSKRILLKAIYRLRRPRRRHVALH